MKIAHMSCRSKAEVVTHFRDGQAESVEIAVHHFLSDIKDLKPLGQSLVG